MRKEPLKLFFILKFICYYSLLIFHRFQGQILCLIKHKLAQVGDIFFSFPQTETFDKNINF